MNFQTLQTSLESIERAKVEIIAIEATDANRTTRDAAYRGLAVASESIEKLLQLVPFAND